MKKFLLLAILLTTISAKSQIISFSDASLFARLKSVGVDTNDDNDISLSEALAVDTLDIDSSDIVSLDDLIHFANLKVLDVSNNKIVSINDSVFSRLTELYCSVNAITTLPTINAPGLKTLMANENEISALVSIDAPELTILSFNSNPIPAVDLSASKKLTQLYFDSTLIKVLDVTGLGQLTKIGAWSIKLDTLIAHSDFNFPSSSLLWSSFTSVSNLDFSNNSAVKGVALAWYNMSSMNLKNCVNLTSINLSTSSLTYLNVDNDSLLVDLMIGVSSIDNLERLIKYAPNVAHINVGAIQDSSLSFLHQYLKLKTLKLGVSNIDSLTFVSHPTLQSLDISGLKSLYVEQCDSLIQILAAVPKVTVKNCDVFTKIDGVSLAEISVEDCKVFSSFPVSWNTYANSIKKVRFINCPALEELNVSWYSSKITELDLTGCVNLKSLYCAGHDLPSLDFSTNTSLERLECNHNSLTTLDISMLTKLTYLNCNTNLLKMLDLRHPHILSHLNVATTDSTFYVCVNDTANIGIAAMNPLPSSDSTLYRECSIVTRLNVTVEPQPKQIIRAFNLLGMQVDPNTKGEVIILEFNDGTRKKVFVVK
jgi:hypothetical protein